MTETLDDQPETDSDEMRRKQPSKIAVYAVPTSVATGFAMLANAAMLWGTAESRDIRVKNEVMKEARAEFISLDRGNNQNLILSADVGEIRRTLAEIKQTISGIPRLEAQLEVLREKVK